jgi:hypothetical protein
MSDIPLDKIEKKSKKVNEVQTPKSGVPAINPQEGKIEVTHENADLLTVHFLAQIHGRLGYIIKLLEEKK